LNGAIVSQRCLNSARKEVSPQFKFTINTGKRHFIRFLMSHQAASLLAEFRHLESGSVQKVGTAFSYLGVKASFPSPLHILIIKRLKMRPFPGCPNERVMPRNLLKKFW
jgi:hypothetical protein